MSNDRLTRIAEGTRYGDQSETTTAEEEDKQNGAIELATTHVGEAYEYQRQK
jgi:hypothetical protein